MIVGLGNPGPRYVSTRHNAGWMVVDAFAQCCGFSRPTMAFSYLLFGPQSFEGKEVCLAKPLTYMNRSGQAVRSIRDRYSIDNKDILVVYDDVALELGRLRLRLKGSAGGHNGMKSVISVLGTEEIPRLRIGISSGRMGEDLIPFVLDNFKRRELPILTDVIDEAVNAIKYWLTEDMGLAMSRVNSVDLSR